MVISNFDFGAAGSPAASRPAAATADGISRSARAAIAKENARYDTDLVRRFNEDADESAFGEIVSRYKERIFSVAWASLRNRSDAEEIAQDTFIRAYRGLSKFRGDCSLATWMHRIALNLARNRYWYYFRRQKQSTLSMDCPLSDNPGSTLANRVASTDAGPIEETTLTECAELFSKCMARLSPGHQKVLRQRGIEDLSYTAIATSLGISIGTVKSRIARARDRLRAEIALMCPEFSAAATPGEWLAPDHLSAPTALFRA